VTPTPSSLLEEAARTSASLRSRRSRLLTLYVGLVVFRYAIYALPGLPRFRGPGELAFSIAIDALLVLFIARGSRVALVVALAFSAFFVVAVVFLSAGSLASGTGAVVAVEVAAIVVLVLLWRALAGDAPAEAQPR
jgi:hypothetical protein